MRKLLIHLLYCLMPSAGVKRKYIKTHGRVKDKGKNNKIIVVGANGARRRVKCAPGSDIEFSGDNNYVELHEPVGNIQLKAKLKSNAEIIIHATTKNVMFSVSQSVHSPNKTRLSVGPDCWSGDIVQIEFQDNANVTIGAGCMISYGVIMRTTDYHTIIKKGTHTVINDNRDIVIGNRVWFGANAMILKGSVIPDNSIIGAHSVVAGKFDEPNVIIAGIPARVIKHDIDWDRRDITTYKRENK